VDLGAELDGEAERVLRDLAASDDPDQRALGVTTLGSLGRGRDLVLRLLGDPEPSVRRTAVRTVASFDSEVAIEALLGALADDDPTVSQAASDAVVGIEADVAESLVPLLGDPTRAAAVLDALVRLPDVDPDVLRSFALEEQGRARRYHAHWRVASTVDEDRVVLLAAGLRHRALRHAAQAVRALAGPLDREAVELDLESAAGRDPAQRAYGLEQLEGSGDPRVIRPLLEVWEPLPARRPLEARDLASILEDDDPWIRACAAFAARSLPDPALEVMVRELAHADPEPEVRDAASWAVRENGAVETLSTVSLLDRVMALGRVPLFRELSPEDLKHVAEFLVENAYPDGSLIAGEGEAGGVMHVVVSGEIQVVRHGDEVELARRGPGYIVGEMSILTGEPRMADLVAVGDVRTLSIDQSRFRRVLRERPNAALAVMRELCFRLVDAAGSRPAAPAHP
jgi:HEAT repeat protein